MLISSHNWMRPEPLEKTLSRLSRCGYDGIEISGEPYKYDIAEVKSLLAKYKIQCWGAVTLMVQGRDLVSHDAEVRAKSIQYSIDCLNMVKALNGQELTVVPGEVGRIISKADPDDEWKWGVEAMRQINKHAKELKLRVAIEPLNRFETNFINTHKQALLLAHESGGDEVGVCLDAFHINIEEKDPCAAIKAVGKKLYDFHVADTNRRPPGEGHHDWDAIIKAIASTGYDGSMTNECVIPFDRTPVGRTTSDSAAMTGISAEDKKFLDDHATSALTDAEYEKNIKATGDYMRRYYKRGGGKPAAAAKKPAKKKSKK